MRLLLLVLFVVAAAWGDDVPITWSGTAQSSITNPAGNPIDEGTCPTGLPPSSWSAYASPGQYLNGTAFLGASFYALCSAGFSGL